MTLLYEIVYIWQDIACILSLDKGVIFVYELCKNMFTLI